MELHFANFGKSPAYGVRIRHWLTIGEGTPVAGFYSQGTPGEGAPIVPNEDRFVTAGSDTEISEQDFTRILETTDKIEIYGNIQYGDTVIAKPNDEIREGDIIK